MPTEDERQDKITEAIQKSADALERESKLRERIGNSFEAYSKELKKVGKIQREISDLKEKDKNATAAESVAIKALIKRLDESKEKSVKAIKATNGFTLAASKASAGFIKALGMVPKIYGKIKGSGLFELDKSIKKSALSMGILSNQTEDFRSGIKRAADDTIEFGIGIGDLAQMQGTFGDAIGRTVLLGKEGLKGMAAMAAATGLGTEGAAQMSAEMELQGYSAERTAEFMNQTMNDAHKMGVNGAKVIKNMKGNMKMLNKYNFKGGVKGFEDMAMLVTKLGVEMTTAAGMADKLFDIDGAVEMSAELQVMGGEWAKLSDPFHLMFMARNDMAGLTEELGKAAESSASFNATSGEMEITALEMHRLRKIAEKTGVAYDDLATMGKKAATFTRISGQMSFSVDDDEDLKEFLSTTAQLDKKGRGYILIEGNKVLLSSLNSLDKDLLRGKMDQKASLEERAKEARTFDDALNNTLNMFKASLLPFIETLNAKLIPKMDDLVEKFKSEKWIEKLGWAATQVGDFVSMFGGMIIDLGKWIITNPIEAMITGGLLAGTALILEGAAWVANGIALGAGFMMSSGGMTGALKGLGGGLLKLGGVVSLAAGVIDLASDAYKNLKDDKLSTSEALWETVTDNAGGIAGAVVGGFLGAAGGPLGIAAGIGYGYQAGNAIQSSIQAPAKDTASEALTKKGGYGAGNAVVSGGKITPVPDGEIFRSYLPGGPADPDSNRGNETKTVKIQHEDFNINFGEIKVSSPGSPDFMVNLMKDQGFINNLTLQIHDQTEKMLKGGVMTS